MDHQLVEWLATLPSVLKISGSESKILLKSAMEAHLPHDVMYRPKMGFAVPLARWTRGPLRQRVRDELLAGPMLETGWFDQQVVHGMVTQHESGRSDHSTPIWVMLMFNACLRNVMQGQSTATQ